MSKDDLYKEKGHNYYSNIRWDIIDLIPDGPHKVLEVGCGTGSTLVKLKEIHKAQEIYGFELNEEMVQEHIQDINKVIIGDIEQLDPPFLENFFDYIIFGDVLEHLVEPEKILKKYMTYLKTEGIIIASIPNIKNYSVLTRLIFQDRFEYKEAGILDRSHLRFFTKREIVNMFDRSGMHIVGMKSNLSYPMNNIDKMLNGSISNHKIPGYSFFTVQYIACAKKRNH